VPDFIPMYFARLFSPLRSEFVCRVCTAVTQPKPGRYLPGGLDRGTEPKFGWAFIEPTSAKADVSVRQA